MTQTATPFTAARYEIACPDCGHHFAAILTSPLRCEACGVTLPLAAIHGRADASPVEPETCTECGLARPLGTVIGRGENAWQEVDDENSDAPRLLCGSCFPLVTSPNMPSMYR
jgi:NAD-dependent dihydropyrimidine dehydrogenase PreA subunit